VAVEPAPGSAREDLRVVTATRKGTDFVTFALRWDSGSVDDPPGKAGLTALVAALLAEGGTKDLSSAQLQRALFPLAAALELRSGEETTTLSARVHTAEVGRFLPILAAIATAPRWDPRELERARADAVSHLERELRIARDGDLGKAALDLLRYPGHPYERPVEGTVAGLRASTIDDAKAHYARAFGRARLTVGLGGPVDDALVTRVRAAFAALGAGDPPRTDTPPAPPADQVRALIVQKDTRSVAISLGFPIEITRAHPDYVALRIAMSAFGEHRQGSGRLYARLREARGLNYGDYAYVERYHEDDGNPIPQPGHPRRRQLFNIWLRPVDPAHALFATRAALFELRRLIAGGLTQAELDRTVGFLAGYSLLWDETERLRLGWALDDSFYGSPASLSTLRRALKQITLAQVNAAIRRHLDPARLRYAFVARDAARLQKALASGEASPIKYSAPRPKDVLEEDKQIQILPLGLGGAATIRVIDGATLFAK
jgi:zinc protease